MGSLATFKTTYLTAATPVLPPGNRAQLAGPVYALEQRVAAGMSYANAQTAINTKRTKDIVLDAQEASTPYTGSLASDFYAIDAA
jgi:hypothetical protein